MPSEAYRKAVQSASERALKSYDALAGAIGEKKAESAVRQLLQSGEQLPKDFAQESSYLPDFVAKDRGSHQRAIVCDREERGVVHLRPAEVLDVTLLLSKMVIEEDTTTAGAWNGKIIEGKVPLRHSSEISCGVGSLTTVVERTRGTAAFLQEFRARKAASSSSSGASASSSRSMEGGANLAGEVKLRIDDVAEPDRILETMRIEVQRMRDGKSRSSKQLDATLATADDPAARREAVEKLKAKTDTTRRDCTKATQINRYVEVAQNWDLPLGSYESLFDFLACSIDNYKTSASVVREVMASTVCRMSAAEKDEMEANLKRLKQRGFVARKENSTPVTLTDIIRANEAGLMTLTEKVCMLLCFYCALRPGEVSKLAVDYQSKIDKPIVAPWEGKDLVLNFVKTSVKSNLYKCIRARCMCRRLNKAGISSQYCVCWCKNKTRLFSCEIDMYKVAVRVFRDIEGIGGHSFRIGAAVTLYRSGVEPLQIVIHCRRTALSTLLGYLRSLPECAIEKFVCLPFAAA